MVFPATDDLREQLHAEKWGRGQYSPHERRVSLMRFVTRRSPRAFPKAAGDIPLPLTLESIAPDPGEHR